MDKLDNTIIQVLHLTRLVTNLRMLQAGHIVMTFKDG